MTEREIFTIALTRDNPAERAAFLDEACSGDDALRLRVESLLVEYQRLGSFMDVPSTLNQPRQERLGTRIGPYKLLQQIGEGGMGVVYMAEQTEPVKRKVALKLIKPGMDSHQVIARFEAERQALAMMDHVNIARVLDAGTTSGEPGGVSTGRPYFVMELIHGVPITKYCDDNHLTPRQRLELFVPVCQAIQHAHQKGIIHRDIKPSNVMITLYDGKPVPKVIDFGVAKATEQKLTERSLFTQYGTMVGTLEYMSPEQAEMSALGVDTRSDIYSLGVLLYELLTGSTPLSRKRMKEAGYAEILRLIKEEEPPRPSTRLSESGGALASISAQRQMEPAKLSQLMRGELDWIVMKTLEKDRNRRYETANGFAADVQRYLNDEQVQACPPSAGYRLRKFVRRNKRGLAAAAVLGMALLVAVGAMAGSLGWVAHDRAARQTAVEVEVKLALKEAEQLQGQEKWPEALSASKRAEALCAGGGSQELSERVGELRKDLEMVLRLEGIRLDGAVVKDDGFVLSAMGPEYAKSFREYGIDVETLEAAEAARRIETRLIRQELVVALDDWAWGRMRQQDQPSNQLFAVARLLDPDDWRNRMRAALEARDGKALVALAASEGSATQPARTVGLLAEILLDREQPLGVKEAIAMLRAAQQLHPSDFWINHDLAYAIVDSQPEEAIGFYRAALALRPNSQGVWLNFGNALINNGKLDEAIAANRQAIHLQPTYAQAHTNLGIALLETGQVDEAIASLREALRLKPDLFNAAGGLGQALVKKGLWNEAIASFERAIRLRKDCVDTHNELAWLLATCPDAKVRDPSRAVQLAEQTVKLAPKQGGFWNTLGVAQYRAGDWKSAAEALNKSMELGKGGDSNDFYFLAMAHWQLGNKVEARQWYDRAVEWMEKNEPNNEELHSIRAEAAELFGVNEK